MFLHRLELLLRLRSDVCNLSNSNGNAPIYVMPVKGKSVQGVGI